MALSRKILILFFLFIMTGLASSYLGLSSRDEKKTSFSRIHFTVPNWEEKGLIGSDAVLNTLQTDVTVFSDYYRGNSPHVNLYIGYYKTLEQSKFSHAPQVCFTAQGWIMEKDDKIELHLGNKDIEVNRLLLKREIDRLLVYYWYQSGHQTNSDLFRMKLGLLFQKFRNKKESQEGNSFIRISTPITDDMESASRHLQDFARDLYPAAVQYFLSSEITRQ